jgi:phosphoserine aminotransferase
MGEYEPTMERGRGQGTLLYKLTTFAIRNSSTVTHNFNAGPSILPREVFEEASRAILNFNGTGLSILEIGHRTPLFESVLAEASQTLRELMYLNSDKEILFLHGGASTQFFQVPMNLLNEEEMAAYLDCGVWGIKAIKEAKLFGQVDVVASSKEQGYTCIPKNYTVPDNARYFHFTTNNTIEGTEMFSIPDVNVPLVADMSSDILSQEMDFNRFGLIYAGAQKNIGAAGVNVVIVDKQMLGKVHRKMPSMMDYRLHIDNGSMLNTPPTYGIYMAGLVFEWLQQQGGLAAIEKMNTEKASHLYDYLDSTDFYSSPVSVNDRSRMNIPFHLHDTRLNDSFLDGAQERGLLQLKGHRSVGGMRASLYNAMPIDGVIALINYLGDFEKHHA